jgi:two-component sensor histidine kinase/PAS domain-containing protein
MYALLVARGETNQFSAAVVSNRAGEIVFRFGQEGTAISAGILRHSIASGWYANTAQRAYYHAVSVPLWLGDGGIGTLTVLWPFDNARLASLSSPGVELFLAERQSLWAASGGNAALTRVSPTQSEGQVEIGGKAAYLLHLPLAQNALLLAAVTHTNPATPFGVMLFGSGILLLLGFEIWLFLGRWMRDLSGGLDNIGQATGRFAFVRIQDEHVNARLHAVEARSDEVGVLARDVRSLMTAAEVQHNLESEAYFKTLAMLEEGVVEIERDGRILHASEGWWRMTRCTVTDDPLWAALDEDDARTLAVEAKRLYDGRQAVINARVRAWLTGAWLECRMRVFDGRAGRVLRGVFNDISAQVQHEALLEKSLGEKTVLLQEIHHRVKNNLQVIHSLLDLQAGRIDDAAIAAQFADTQARVRSMALIHQTLYQSHNFSAVDFSQYLRTLLNEFASAHARAGCIRLTLSEHDTTVSLLIADDGVGLPQTQGSLGMQLVQILAEQLKATLHVGGPRVCSSVCALIALRR